MRVLISLTVGAAVLAIFLLLSGNLIQEPREFARRGQLTEGKVVKLHPREHQRVDYRYQVGASTYFGTGQAGRGTPPFEQLSVGDRVPVFYLPDHPDQSLLGDPSSVLAGNTISAIGGALLLFVFATIGTYRWFGRPGLVARHYKEAA